MSDRIERIELYPVGAPLKLPRPEGYKVVSTETGPRGEALRLLTNDESAQSIFARIEQPGWASFPKTRTESGYSAVLFVCSQNGIEEFHLPSLTATIPRVQMFPNDEILVVAPRCWKFQDGSHELNARVYDAGGNLKREFLLGDGIEHVQTDRKGNIWVGYFDEGVYGNYGWGNSNDRLGAAGLSCFNDKGEKLWDFQPPAGCDPISDCYALNASKDGIWTYYYTGFPLVRIGADWRTRAWNTQTAGGREFAVHDRNILHYGGYGEHRTDCKLLRLGQNSVDVAAEVVLILPDGVELSKATVIGRDNKLHVFYEDDWYVFSADSVS